MDPDAGIRWASRLFTLLAGASFVAWLVVLVPAVLLLAILLGAAAYASFLVDRRRNLGDLGGYGRDADDRVLQGSETAVGPAVSAGGIHLSFLTRSRWRAKR